MTLEAEIVMYGTSRCSDCHRSMRVMQHLGVSYRYVDIDEFLDGRLLVQQVNGGMSRVPTIVFPDGSVLVEPANQDLIRKVESLTETGSARNMTPERRVENG